jgi:hypothetical protein
VLTVAANGKLLSVVATPRAPQDKRLGDHDQACLLRTLKAITFPRGSALVVTTVVHGGPR